MRIFMPSYSWIPNQDFDPYTTQARTIAPWRSCFFFYIEKCISGRSEGLLRSCKKGRGPKTMWSEGKFYFLYQTVKWSVPGYFSFWSKFFNSYYMQSLSSFLELSLPIVFFFSVSLFFFLLSSFLFFFFSFTVKYSGECEWLSCLLRSLEV